MWNRIELKAAAKQRFHSNYWPSVVVAVILSITLGTFSFGNSFSNATSDNYYSSSDINNILSDSPIPDSSYSDMSAYMKNYISSIFPGVNVNTILQGLSLIILIVGLLSILLNVFVFNPLQVGCQHWFIRSRTEDNYNIGSVGFTFKEGYGNVTKTMFLKQLYTFFWSLLFVFPGIIKSYEYRMIPYLLAENPYMSTDEAFARSRSMMDGEKWNAFVLDLSFIGWNILSSLTLGLVGLFYVAPYQAYTDMELYVALCSKPNNGYNGTNYNSYNTNNGYGNNNSYNYDNDYSNGNSGYGSGYDDNNYSNGYDNKYGNGNDNSGYDNNSNSNYNNSSNDYDYNNHDNLDE